MKRTFATFALVATAALGLSACSAPSTTDSESAAAPASGSAATAPAEQSSAAEAPGADEGTGTGESAAGRTVAEACDGFMDLVAKAESAIVSISTAQDLGGQAAVDAFLQVSDSFKEFAQTAGNEKVSEAAQKVATSAETLADETKRATVDKDVSQMDKQLQATVDLSDSMTAMESLCVGGQ